MTLHIREATLDDVELIAQLLMTVHQLHQEAMPERYQVLHADNPELLQHYRERLSKPEVIFFIAELDGVAVGYVSCAIEEYVENLYVFGQRRLHIDQISVNDSAQGQGVGKALMQRAIELGKQHDVDAVTLGVTGFNQKALGFYQHLGFEISSYRMSLALGD